MIKQIKRRTLPALSPKAPAELRPLFAAMMEIMEIGEGVRGDKLDRKLTLRDLLDGGIAKLRVQGNPDGGITLPEGPQNMAVPPRPIGFAADGSFFGMIHLSWESPQEQYNNHSITNIYRSEEDNFATAEIIGREPGMFYSDIVRNDATIVDDPLNLPGYYYWISFVSESNVEGPPNSPSGTFAQPIPDAAYLLGQLSGQLGESQLEQDLRGRIDLIDAPASMAGSVAARIEKESTERTAGYEANAEEIRTLYARSDQSNAAIQETKTAIANEKEARADDIRGVQTAIGENSASIRSHSQSINGLSASYTLKTDVNGYVAGYGTYNDGETADFAVLADRFWVAQPGKPASAIKPFMIVDGRTYIDSAFIREASIQEGQLGPITIGKLFDSAGNPITTVGGLLRADMIDVDKLRVGDANIAGILKSSVTDNEGRPRWQLDKDGGFQMNGGGIGGRSEIRENLIQMWYPNGQLMLRMGDW